MKLEESLLITYVGDEDAGSYAEERLPPFLQQEAGHGSRQKTELQFPNPDTRCQ